MEIVAEGLGFPEGPVALSDGSVVVVEIEAARITRVYPNGGKQTIAEVGGGPNGLALGPDGKLYCVNNGGFRWREVDGLLIPHGIAGDYSGGRVERVDIKTGKIELVYRSGDFGCTLRGPNDIVFDRHGGCWFTDHGKVDYTARCRDIVGVFYAKSDGSLLEEVIFPLDSPNGIGLSPNGECLYVAESSTCQLRRFDILAPGRVHETASLSGPGSPIYRPSGWKMFDSLALEECGNICIGTLGEAGISVVSPDGELVEFIPTPDVLTTNLCFGGHDMMDAWICLSSSGRLAKTRWKRPGLRLNA